MVGSARVSTLASVEEEDQRARSTKKVKPREDHFDGPAGVMGTVASYKEKLLNLEAGVDDTFLGAVHMPDEELAENRWYVEREEEREVTGNDSTPYPEVRVSDEELADWCSKWERTLVVNVLGKKVNFKVLENKIKREWTKTGKIQIIDMPRGYYAVKFTSDEDYKHALMEGPWMVADHYLLVQRWRPNFLKNADTVRRIAVWLRIPELPLELYNDKFLWRLGSTIGCMLKIDHLTSIHSRGKFARICVEVDLSKKLVPKVMVRGELLNVEYEGLHAICFSCGMYGHKVANCPTVIQHTPANESSTQNRQLVVAATSAPHNASSSETHGTSMPIPMNQETPKQPEYGPWMIVTRPTRKKVRNPPPNVSGSNMIGNQKMDMDGDKIVEDYNPRFNILDKNDDKGNRIPRDAPTIMEVESNISKFSNQVQPTPIKINMEVSKVRNSTGGKNPQGGPRFSDVKKGARGLGIQIPSLKKSLSKPKGPTKGKGVTGKQVVVQGAHCEGPQAGKSMENQYIQTRLAELRAAKKASTIQLHTPSSSASAMMDGSAKGVAHLEGSVKANGATVGSQGSVASQPQGEGVSHPQTSPCLQ